MNRYKDSQRPPSLAFSPRLRITLNAGAVLWVAGPVAIHAYAPSGTWLQTWFVDPTVWKLRDIRTFVDYLNQREHRVCSPC